VVLTINYISKTDVTELLKKATSIANGLRLSLTDVLRGYEVLARRRTNSIAEEYSSSTEDCIRLLVNETRTLGNMLQES